MGVVSGAECSHSFSLVAVSVVSPFVAILCCFAYNGVTVGAADQNRSRMPSPMVLRQLWQ